MNAPITKSQSTEATQASSEFQFIIQRLYVKDLSFEAPNTPEIFQQEWNPELNLDINNSHQTLNPTTYEVVLDVTVTVKNQSQTAFLVQIKQAGIFTIQGATAPEQLDHLLESFCPSILFPYAREAITNEVVRGSFPQLVIAPINFEALYLSKLEAKHAQKNQTESETSS